MPDMLKVGSACRTCVAGPTGFCDTPGHGQTRLDAFDNDVRRVSPVSNWIRQPLVLTLELLRHSVHSA